ncbi:MAG: response regulator [Phycisphaerae bacterium]|nr:response regulator [Phycisphaerae bacterium]
MLDETIPTLDSTIYRPHIMIVEDDPEIAEMLHDHLKESLNAELDLASSAQEALEFDAENPADVILVDYMLPDMDGLDLITPLNARKRRPIILITGHPTLGRAIEAMRLGAVDMLVKPFDLEILTEKISQAFAQYQQEQRRMNRIMRIRRLSKKVIAERRSLRRKLDVLCKDIVGSYRELAEKVNFVDHQQRTSKTSQN